MVKIQSRRVVDLLVSLVDKSLVVYEPQPGRPGRYRLLETTRQYAREKLKESGREATAREQHRDHFLQLAVQARDQQSGPEPGVWLERLETEHANLRLALDWCLSEEDGAEVGMRLANMLAHFWSHRGHISEGRTYLAEVLAREGDAGRTVLRAKTLNNAGVFAWSQHDNAPARRLLEESLAIWREIGDKVGMSGVLLNLGLVAYNLSDYAASRKLLEESLALNREFGDRGGIALSLNNLGVVALYQGDYATARALFEESLTIRRELGQKGETAVSLVDLGDVAYCLGEYEKALTLYKESLSIRRELGDKAGIAGALSGLGNVARKQGAYDKAKTLYKDSLTLFQELGNKLGSAHVLTNLGIIALDQGNYSLARGLFEEGLDLNQQAEDKKSIASSLEAFASLAVRQDQPQRAARLWGAAESLREVIGSPLPPNAREEYECSLADLRAAIDEVAFAAFWEAGRQMTLEEAFAYALREEKNARS